MAANPTRLILSRTQTLLSKPNNQDYANMQDHVPVAYNSGA